MEIKIKLDVLESEDSAQDELKGPQFGGVENPIKLGPSTRSKSRAFLPGKRLLLAILLLLLFACLVYLNREGFITPEGIFLFLRSHPTLAPVVFVFLYGVMSVFSLPTLPLNLGAGFLWGPWMGSLLSFLGVITGASCPFFISRYLAGEYFRKKFKFKIWIKLEQGIDKHGWKIVAFTRLTPGIPFGALNYFFGITSISFANYILSTALFISPLVILFATIGHSTGEAIFAGENIDVTWNILVISVAVVFLFLSRYLLKRFFKK